MRLYPARGVRYESHLAPPPHLVGLRIAALDALLVEPEPGGEAAVMVASAVALAEKVPDPELRPHGFAIEKGGLLDLDETAAQLVACGYERVDQVEERGQFALRGDILDVYPATEERAVRCELFDVEVERLTFFSTFTQRSLEEVETVAIEPAAELAPEQRELAEMAAEDEAEDRPDIAELLPVDRFGELLDLLPETGILAVAAEEELAPALRDYWEDVTTSFHDADAHHLYVSPERLEEAIDARASLRLSSISGDQPHAFRAQAADTAARSLRAAEPELEKLVRSGYRTIVAWARRGEAERAAYNLDRVRAALLDGKPAPHEPGVSFAAASLREGFLSPQLKLAIVPEHRLLRRRRADRPAGPRTGAGAIASFTDLRAGSPVVHEDHGIGRFTGFETKTVGGITRDYLELEFRGGDRVFVPSDQIHKISRYVGADAADPPLSKLGGKQWEQQKLRARRAAEALAGELINLYAERKRRAGHAFPADGEWQLEFEAAFPYRETPDQLEAIEAVRADMEEARPMDRLICGDVGYGKTEVALRAAFKAAADGKQVMFLVPTTVLAQQHFGTFTERLRDYPFRIEMVSRFRSAKETRAALKDYEEGKVDIMIGTHRLLSRDVRPKDLGLLIVDEEQRFGVKQKELLRQLKLRVDVLSLSATPIPRTLQMSLAGLRDITVIETPPEGRRPVKTYVGDYDEELVKKALDREVERGGQAFFLHNRVETIDETAERVRAMCPKARVLVAHGQMDEGQLEKVMLAFLRGEADILVCTTIVESGLDISSANTLIVERADELGPGAALPDQGARGPLSGARLRVPALPVVGRAERGGGGAAVDALRLHRARLGLQDRHARPRDPRRGQPAGRRAVRPRGGGGIRAVRVDARRGRAALGRRLRGRGAGARAHRRAGGRLRARRVRALRGGQDRDPPARVRGQGDRGPPHAARGAGGPLRPGARAAVEPDQDAGRPDQAGPRRCAQRGLRGRAAGRGADRPRFAPGEAACASGSRRRSTSRGEAPCACAFRTSRRRASPRWWPRRRRSSRPSPSLLPVIVRAASRYHAPLPRQALARRRLRCAPSLGVLEIHHVHKAHMTSRRHKPARLLSLAAPSPPSRRSQAAATTFPPTASPRSATR